MSRDYRHAEVFSAGTRPLPLWLWFFAALAVSGFVGLIYYLDSYEKSKTHVSTVPSKGLDSGVSSNRASSKEDSKETASENDKPSFDFYKLLPKLRVEVPKGEPSSESQRSVTLSEPAPTAITHEPVVPPANSPPIYSYVLQAGSFKEYREADRLKANLALTGIQANIEKVVLNGSDVWHRVRVGPIHSERQMNKIRAQLRNQNIAPILLKVKEQQK